MTFSVILTLVKPLTLEQLFAYFDNGFGKFVVLFLEFTY